MKSNLREIDKNIYEIYKQIIPYFITFGLSAICMYIILARLGYSNHGKYTLAFGDLRDNYIPAIRMLCRDILNGESIYFSWNTAMGMNTSMYNAYYAYNPFNVLYLMFYNSDVGSITLIIIVVKTGLTAMSFFHYTQHGICIKNVWCIVFSLLYSLCSFQVAYNTTNTIWLDAMFVLPMVLNCIDVLFENSKYASLIFWYTYIFITQFYMGYMIGIVSLCYFILKLITNRDIVTHCPKKLCTIYTLCLLSAVGLSAWVWIPALSFILNNNPVDATTFGRLNTRIPEFYRAFFFREVSGINAKIPNLYCGIVSVLLLPTFVCSRNVSAQNKIIYGSSFALLVISCFSDFLYKMWHGFDNPDGWTFRFTYMIPFFVCVMATIAISALDNKTIKMLVISLAGETVAYIVAVKYSWGIDSGPAVIGSLTFLAAWVIIIVVYTNEKIRKAKLYSIFVVILAVAEILLSYDNQEILKSDTLKAENTLWELTHREVMEELKQDKDFYRIDYKNDLCMCAGAYFGYNGMSHYSTAENPVLRMTMSKLGMYSAPRVLLNYGLTPVTNALFAVKYDVEGALLRKDSRLEDTYAKIYHNDNILSIGYMVEGNVDDYILKSHNAFENNNYILSIMIGKKTTPFTDIPLERIRIEGKNAKTESVGDGYMMEVIHPERSDVDTCIEYHIDSDKAVYSYVYQQEPNLLLNRGFVLEGGEENSIRKLGNLSASYIKQLEKRDDGYFLRITPIDNTWRQSYDGIFFAEYDEAEMIRAYDELKDEQLVLKDYKDGYIRGEISIEDNKQILFTSIPYDKGWSVRINGNKGDVIPIMNNSFIAVLLPQKGNYTLEFEFNAVGARVGLAISIVTSFVVLSMAWIVKNRRDYITG